MLEKIKYETQGTAYPIGAKFYYGDSSTFVILGSMETIGKGLGILPKEDLQIIAIHEQTKIDDIATRVILCGRDYYYYDPTEKVLAATNDLVDIAENQPVIKGKWMTDEDFLALSVFAMKDDLA